MKEREQDTRRQRIDPKLAASGWAIEAATKAAPAGLSVPTALTELPTHDGPADYALCADGRVIGVVEAKKLTIGPQGVLTQAERYSRGIQQQPRYQGEYGVPFLYSTNGEVIRFHDVRREPNRSRDVSAFHTPDALRELLRARLRLGAGEAERDPAAPRAQALPGRSEPGDRGRDRCRQAPDARHDGHRHGQDADDGQRDLPADEVRRRAARAVPRRPPGPGRADRAGVRLLRGRAGPEVRQGLPRLLPALPAGRPRRRGVRPQRHAQHAAHQAQARRRVRVHLDDPADDDEPVRRCGGADDRRRGRRGRRREARHPDPRLRPDRRGRVPPRLLGQGAGDLARHAGPLRRDQDRPHRDPRRPHDGLLREPGVPLRLRPGGPRRLPRRLRRREGLLGRADQRHLPRTRASRSTRSTSRAAPSSSTCSTTSARSTPRRSSGRSPPPTPTGGSSRS